MSSGVYVRRSNAWNRLLLKSLSWISTECIPLNKWKIIWLHRNEAYQIFGELWDESIPKIEDRVDFVQNVKLFKWTLEFELMFWRRANLSIRPSESDTNFKHICTCDRLNYISCINIWVINAIQRSSAVRREYIIAKCVLYCVYCTLHIGPTSCPPV